VSLVLTLSVCAHLIENVNSHVIVKDQLDLFHEFLTDRDVIATELVKGCSRRRSLGQFTEPGAVSGNSKWEIPDQRWSKETGDKMPEKPTPDGFDRKTGIKLIKGAHPGLK
jgi:hypothetical protein